MQNNKSKHGRLILDYSGRNRAVKNCKLVAQILVIIFIALLRSYGAMPFDDVNKLANAIYRIEGVDSKYPYGIKSITTTNKAQARQICITTIRNNHSRWLNQNKEKYYLFFLADKYCPPSADRRGNLHWRTNVVSIMGREFFERYKR